MYQLITACIHRARAILTIMLALVLGGLTAYINLPKEADPDIPIPIIYVGVTLPGISPADAERLIVKPLEFELRRLKGLKEMRSSAVQNHGSVIVEFDVSFDKEQALIDVREKVDLARSRLPADAKEPLVREFNASLFPVITVSLTGSIPERELFARARALKDTLSALPNVLEANLTGNREEVLEIIVDPLQLENYAITVDDIYRIVTRNNQLVPAGDLNTESGRFAVSVPGLIESADDLFALPIKTQGDSVVRLADVAQIKRNFKTRTHYARFNGDDAISIQIVKRLGANVIATTRQVRATTKAFTADWSKAIKVSFSSDISSHIFSMLGDLQIAITNAILLVMILVVAALGLRSALLVGIAIPTSFLIGFLFIALMGYTINMMILFGMVLSVGILVDGAIVVVEYADRKMAEGIDRKQAYAMAANRMLWPIAASTATTLAAFAPMLFWPGVSGKFMSYLPITVIFVLSASLLTAMLFLPVLGGVFGKSEQEGDAVLASLAADSKADLHATPGMTGYYLRFLARCIKHPLATVGVAFAVLFAVIVLYGKFGRGVEFFTPIEPDQAQVFIKARGNIANTEADRMTRIVEGIVLSTPGIKSAFTQASAALGSGGGSSAMVDGFGDAPRDVVGQILIEFTNFKTRKPATQVMADIERRAAQIPGIAVELRAQVQGPPVGKALEIEVSGTDLSAMQRMVARIHAYMLSRPKLLKDIEDTRPLPGIEWALQVDREAAGRFGADVSSVGGMVQLVTNGILLGRYRPDDSDDEIDIRVRYPYDQRSANMMDSLRINTPSGSVPMSNFVTRQPQQKVSQIARVDGIRILDIKADTHIDPKTGLQVLAEVAIADFQKWLATQKIPRGVQVKLRGSNEEQQEAAAFLGRAMLASLMLMFIILLLQFNSFYFTLLTLSTVVMSTIGVLLGMVITSQTFSVIMSGTGVVALAGIVVNNSIVLIDTYQRMLRADMSVIDAVLRTAGQRLRPILLTTITTMIGLFPMAVQISVNFLDRSVNIDDPNSAWWVQMATAIIFGLGFSTLLTLVVIPVMLTMPHQIRAGWHARATQIKTWARVNIQDKIKDRLPPTPPRKRAR